MRRKLILIIPALLFIAIITSSQNGLVGYWSFDNMTGDTIANESEFNHPVINHGATLIKGIRGKALSFNGSSDFAEIPGSDGGTPDHISKLGTGSISFWFKADHIPTDFGIAPMFYYGMQDQCQFFDAANKGLIIELGHSPVHYQSERLYFTIWKNGCTVPSFCFDSNDPIPEGAWHHIVVVVGEDYNTGYLNGKQMSNRRYNFGDASYSQFFEDALEHEKLWLGKGHWDETTQFFDGAIDELRIYNKPLSQSEVSALYSNNITSIEQKDNSADINLYPVPSGNVLNYKLNQTGKEIKNIILTDINGRLVLNRHLRSTQGSFDISNVPEGFYFAEFVGGENTLRKKVLIRR